MLFITETRIHLDFCIVRLIIVKVSLILTLNISFISFVTLQVENGMLPRRPVTLRVRSFFY